MNSFDLARRRMLAAWQREASGLCQADAQAEVAATFVAMRRIMQLAVDSSDRGDKIFGPPAALTTDGPE